MNKNVARSLLSHKTEDTVGVIPIPNGWFCIDGRGLSVGGSIYPPYTSVVKRSSKAVDTEGYFGFHSWEVIEYEARTRWYEELAIWFGGLS